jgi:hypothetical protein
MSGFCLNVQLVCWELNLRGAVPSGSRSEALSDICRTPKTVNDPNPDTDLRGAGISFIPINLISLTQPVLQYQSCTSTGFRCGSLLFSLVRQRRLSRLGQQGYETQKGKEMNKRSVVIAATIVFILAIATAAIAADDPWAGTWKLNPAKSKAPGGRLPHPSSTNVIEIQGETMHMIVDQTYATGKLEHVEYTAKLDGKEYPVKVSPPSPGPYTISLKLINPRTREFVENIGKRTIKGQDVLSEDGKSFSRIVNSKDAEGHDTSILQFFEKQ